MGQGENSNSDANSKDPFSLLGIEPGASFDEVQKAKEARLSEVGEDIQARAQIEASYDAFLMNSLKERQLGKVSNAAEKASQRESRTNDLGGTILTRLKGMQSESSKESSQGNWPELNLPSGSGMNIRIALGLLAVVLVLISPPQSVDLILSLSTIGLCISQVKRGRRILSSIGWSVVLLSIGLIVGGLIVSNSSLESTLFTSLSKDQLEAMPAVVLIWMGSFLLS